MAEATSEKVEDALPTKASFSFELARFRTRVHSFYEPDSGIVGKRLKLEIGTSYLPDVKEKTFFLGMSIRVRTSVAEEDEYEFMLHHHTTFAFDFVGMEQLVRGEFFYLPVKWLQRLTEIAYDTSRGLILARSGGSLIDGWILPLLEEDFIEPNLLKLGVDWSEEDIKIAKEFCVFKIGGEFKNPDQILDEKIEKEEREATEKINPEKAS